MWFNNRHTIVCGEDVWGHSGAKLRSSSMWEVHLGRSSPTPVYWENKNSTSNGGLNPLKHKQISAVDKNRLEKFESN